MAPPPKPSNLPPRAQPMEKENRQVMPPKGPSAAMMNDEASVTSNKPYVKPEVLAALANMDADY